MLVQILFVVCVGTACAESWIGRAKGLTIDYHFGGIVHTVADGGHALYATDSSSNVTLAKFSSAGDPDPLGSKSYGQGQASGIDALTGGGYLVTASTPQCTGAWVAKLDANGGVTTDQKCSNMPGAEGYYIKASGASAYLVSKDTFTFGNITKFNTTTWAVEWEGALTYLNNTVRPTAIEVDATGNLFITGVVHGDDGYIDAFVAKISSAGAVLAFKVLQMPGSEWSRAIARLGTDGSVVLAGDSRIPPAMYDVWVVKLDANLNTVWQKTFSGPGNGTDWANNVAVLTDGTIVVGATTHSFSPNQKDEAWVIRLEDKPNPTVKWQKRYATLLGEQSYALTATDTDGGLLLAAEGRDMGSIWGSLLFKTDVNGNIAAHDASGASIANPYVFDTNSIMTNTNAVAIDALSSISFLSQGFNLTPPATPVTPVDTGLTYEKVSY